MGTRERRVREKEERRRQIVNAARRLFLEKGYEGATIPKIAEAAELAPGTLYLYFSGKEALYIELLKEGYDMLLARLMEASRRKASPRRQAEAVMDAFTDFAREHPDYFDIIFFVLQSARREIRQLSAHRDLLEKLLVREKACKDFAAEILGRARPRGTAAERARQVEAVWSMLAGVVLYFVRDEAGVFDSVAGAAKEIILRGIVAEA